MTGLWCNDIFLQVSYISSQADSCLRSESETRIPHMENETEDVDGIIGQLDVSSFGAPVCRLRSELPHGGKGLCGKVWYEDCTEADGVK